MSAYLDGKTWRYRRVIKLGEKRFRISGTPNINTKRGAEDAEREHIERAEREYIQRKHAPESLRVAAPTLTEWFRGDAKGEEEFSGRFWTEFVVGEKENRDGTRTEKRKVFVQHIEPSIGSLSLDDIDIAVVNNLRAELAAKDGRRGKKLSAKTRANIMGVLATALRYAFHAKVIRDMPAIKVKAVPPPPIEPWTFEEYGRLLGAALPVEPWSTAVLLAGESGLRIGEIVALDWSDLDLVANTITIQRQERQGKLGPPKGGKARTVPMTARLAAHLRAVPRMRIGRVVAIAGDPVTEGEAKHALERICRAAGLPARLWHRLRHTFATHAAMLGVGPVRLKNWLGHSTLNMTLRYVAFAEEQSWPIADEILVAGSTILHPDKRITAMLGARPIVESCQPGAKTSRRSSIASESHLKLVGAAGIEPVSRSLKSRG